MNKENTWRDLPATKKQIKFLTAMAIDSFSNMSRGQASQMIEKIKDSTTCPNCGKTSHDMLETLYLFGLRIMKDAIRVQSWCIACRSAALRSVRDAL